MQLCVCARTRVCLYVCLRWIRSGGLSVLISLCVSDEERVAFADCSFSYCSQSETFLFCVPEFRGLLSLLPKTYCESHGHGGSPDSG